MDRLKPCDPLYVSPSETYRYEPRKNDALGQLEAFVRDQVKLEPGNGMLRDILEAIVCLRFPSLAGDPHEDCWGDC